jgi:CheY-like chemotaxis protein
MMSTEFQPEGARIVLVVEDEPVLRASMVRGLSKLPGVEVVDAASVRDAKELIRALDASLLISDLDLPDGSGVELAAEMDRCGKRAPIVFVSAYVGKFRGQVPVRPGIDVHEKPVSMERLRALVESHLGATASEAETSPFSVADYVQLAAMGRRSVQLEVTRGAASHGTIVIRSGEVWTARDARGLGLDAFRRLAFARDVTIACHALSGDAGPRTIHGSAEGVLLEAARLVDEGKVPVDEEPQGPLALELDDGWSEGDSRTTSGERAVTRASHVFDEHFERGVDALLSKNHHAAYLAFLEASHIKPDDPRVIANLHRLREMGHAGDPGEGEDK